MCFGFLKKLKDANIPLSVIGGRNHTFKRKGELERFIEGERLATRNAIKPITLEQSHSHPADGNFIKSATKDEFNKFIEEKLKHPIKYNVNK